MPPATSATGQAPPGEQRGGREAPPQPGDPHLTAPAERKKSAISRRPITPSGGSLHPITAREGGTRTNRRSRRGAEGGFFSLPWGRLSQRFQFNPPRRRRRFAEAAPRRCEERAVPPAASGPAGASHLPACWRRWGAGVRIGAAAAPAAINNPGGRLPFSSERGWRSAGPAPLAPAPAGPSWGRARSVCRVMPAAGAGDGAGATRQREEREGPSCGGEGEVCGVVLLVGDAVLLSKQRSCLQRTPAVLLCLQIVFIDNQYRER